MLDGYCRFRLSELHAYFHMPITMAIQHDRIKKCRQVAFSTPTPSSSIRPPFLFHKLGTSEKSSICQRTSKVIVTASSRTVDSDFSKWASSVGISMPSIHLTTFNTKGPKSKPVEKYINRGLSAASPISKKSVLIKVPSKSALQVTSSANEKPPQMFDIPRPEWRRLPWFVKLGLMVISARRDKNHHLHAWTNRLPTDVDIPYHWSDSEIAQLQSERLKIMIKQQEKAYDGYYKQVSQFLPREVVLSKGEFLSAVDCVRSRAFSGPLETAPFRDRLQLSLFVAVNTFVWPLLNVLTWENALNGGLTAMFSLAMFDILYPRIQRVMGGVEPKRFAMVPGVDMFNHDALRAGDSKVDFRYFTDSFEILASSDYAVDEEVYISYGAQSNDSFLQYYGFVEDENPAEDFVFDKQVSNELGLSDGQLVARRTGFDARVVGVVEKRLGGDKKKAFTVLRKLCEAQIGIFESTADEDTELLQTKEATESCRLSLAIRYRRSKKQLLQKLLDEWGNKT